MRFKSGMEEKYNKGKANNASDPYGARCFSYAEDWAELMEREIGASLDADPADVIQKHAKRCASEADYDGITGFMYGMAVQILSDCWEHGETLRRWSNSDLQLKDEGDRANEKEGVVLNPALLTVE